MRASFLLRKCCPMPEAEPVELRSALLCKTLASTDAIEQTPTPHRWRGKWHRESQKTKNLRNPEQPRGPRLCFGRERRARQDVLLDEPPKGVALAQFGVQRHGDLAQGLAEGPIT